MLQDIRGLPNINVYNFLLVIKEVCFHFSYFTRIFENYPTFSVFLELNGLYHLLMIALGLHEFFC